MSNKIFFLLIISQLLLASGCRAAQDKNGDQIMSENQKPQKTHYHVIGESKAIEAFGKELSKPDEAWDLIHEGSRLYRNKEYDLATLKLKRALELPGGDKWVARSRLEEAYEAKGEYALALKEVTWKIEQHQKEEVPAELLNKKQNLEKLLADQAQTRP